MEFVLPKRPKFTTVDSLNNPHLFRMNYVQPKLDGHWTAVHVDAMGRVKAYTRTGVDITASIKVNEWYTNLLLWVKGPITIVGELWRKDLPCSSITTALANCDPLSYFPFHVEGIKDFKRAKEYCYSRNLHFMPYMEGPFSYLQLCEYFDLYANVYAPADGLVFSNGPGVNCIKWKQADTIELVLYTWRRGQGKYKHTLGKLILRTAEGYEVAAASGMTDIERDWIKDNFENCRGKVVEIKYNGVGVNGRLRHPRFVRFRTDKLPEECGTSQDQSLKKYWDKWIL